MISPFAQFDPNAFDVVITCAEGLENALLTELALFGLTGQLMRTGRVRVRVSLTHFYKICLYSRVASRVLLPIGEYYFCQKTQTVNQVRETSGQKTTRTVETKVIDEDVPSALYEFASRYDWTSIFGVDNTFVIRLSTDKRLNVNQQFATLRIKDAVVDCFNRKLGERPSVDKSPDFHIYAHATSELCELYLDLSGTSLHRRGYRVANTDAPLKENLASALLYECGWYKGEHTALIDPMCGSGTFITEALLMRTNYPVGIDKKASEFGFYHWEHHDNELWQSLANEALNQFHDNLAQLEQDFIAGKFTVIASDANAQAVKACHKNLLASALAPIAERIGLAQRPLAQLKSALATLDTEYTLVITNPPYGERLGESDLIKPLYHGLGLIVADGLRGRCKRADLAVLASHVEHADTLPIVSPNTLKCHNGVLTVYFRHGQIDVEKTNHANTDLIANFIKKDIDNPDSQEFINRLQKNIANLKKYAIKYNISNMRIYDADLPNYNVAIDVYGDKIHVQEYAPPKQIPVEVAKARFNLVLSAIRDIFHVHRESIFIKTRMRQSGNDQYTKTESKNKKMYIAHEHDAYLYVNFTDYLDTGLFIDHRNMREIIKHESRGKHVLNLFAYTCTASVHSAMGGAKSVTSVDLSANYLNWGKQNFALNGLDLTASTLDEKPKYEFIATDVFEWLKNNTEQFDLIFIDPPTFSNSKKFKGTFDVQRDHVALISRAMNRLTSNGVLYFSNNFTKFELSKEVKNRYEVIELTDKTVGVDFNLKKPIHQSFKITHKNQTMRTYDVQSDFDAVVDDWVNEDCQDHQTDKNPHSKFDKKSDFKRKDHTKGKFSKLDKKSDFKKRDFNKFNDKKSDDKNTKGGIKNAKAHFRANFDKNVSELIEMQTTAPTKPKMRYEKVDGKLVAMPVIDNQSQNPITENAPKKYKVKSKN
ncbi:MAG: bifunctional 23S rRNA (guanine(2069)-N(7))-methyltransferase RlmK/23S rRNA (guanine(2445)-N(2))-methyltransferase RlmL [Moraxella sp.]|nr:bifunctional 23S rRNA (guanine(2069)-N(7))-methyltransferase RlmK/23S rRNA (guanine(2445)-N(2))-methyltransferase RlmL [Moraxella sp.]MDO4449396.1 bifunctional 23S rRNA (guanine(2069)-N(7))-methyltransferase RlmK/23S rRNA (guanine(2445)-N(2))-methyltransferase RlmL [Moraxella sp.]